MARFFAVQLVKHGMRSPAVFLIKVRHEDRLASMLRVVGVTDLQADGRLVREVDGEVPPHAVEAEQGVVRLPGFNVEDDFRRVSDWSRFRP